MASGGQGRPLRMSAIYVALAAAQCWADGTLYRRGKAERGPRLSEMDHRVIHWRVLVGEPVAHVLFGEPVSTSPGHALADDDARPRPEPGQQDAKPRHRQRHAPGGGPEARPRHVDEDGAAAAGDPRPGVVVELDDEVVELVSPP